MGIVYKIKIEEMTEYYSAQDGNTVLISIQPDGAAVLVMYDSLGVVFECGYYRSRKGAVNAMRRKYGRCRFHHMTQTVSRII